MISKLLYLLSTSQKKTAYSLIFVILIMALLELTGIASIMPFIALLTNPDIIESNSILKNLYENSKILGVENSDQFLFLTGIVVLLILLISISFKFFTFYLQLRFLAKCEFTIAQRMIEGYLQQPYSWFLNRHSSNLGKIILSEVNRVISGGLSPLLTLLSQVMTSVFVIILLVVVDFKISLIVGFVLGGAYAVIYSITKKYTKYIGNKFVEANQWRFNAIFEAFSAVKEIKIFGLENSYATRFAKPSKTLARFSALAGIVNHLPRFFLEAIIFGGMMLLILVLMKRSGNFIDILPVITLFAFAGYRLMPALQKIYLSINQLILVKPALDILYKDLTNLDSAVPNQKKSTFKFDEKLVLKDINFYYPNSIKKAIKNMNISIPVNSFTAFVGPTGSGKTTIIDIILGLISPQEGSLEIDGQKIDKHNCRSWQQNIGYVPQNIYLSDDTINSNIAFGVEVEKIDHEAVLRASKIANLHDFVVNDLPKKYDTTIGERGIRLSGGQRQRIGIARALYNNPKILILDEATNSLDNHTEKEVMESIYNITDNITVIIIAHRLNTIKGCDKIFYLEKGELKEQGNFHDLVQKKIMFGESTINFKKK